MNIYVNEEYNVQCPMADETVWSGSVSGLTLKLIRTSVIEMLETLSDDDFVNVVSNMSIRESDCLHLYLFQHNHSVFRANCNKIIMLFTDGGEEKAQEIFDKYNLEKKVRVFTFSVGQHNYDKGPIQWMACANKGYYYEIPSIGAIRINTQEYLDVLGRPMVLAGKKAKQVQWTNVYLDALELGLVISGTLPVFNLTVDQNDKQNQLILGVMGVDVSLEEIKKLTPRFTLCPNGYYFAIDPNGYVLLHPNLQPKHIGVGIPKIRKRRPYVQNPKSQEPVTLDFLDAELENDIKVEAIHEITIFKIRKKMIDGESGYRTFRTLVKSQDERYIDKGNRTYTWTAVNGTDYSLALVLPSYSFYYIKANLNEALLQARFTETLKLDRFDEFGYTFLAPREYCGPVKITDNNTAFLLNFSEYIDRYTPQSTSCNDMVMRALLDAGFTSELVQNYWSKQDPGQAITARFVATDGGITRVYPKSAGEYWTENAETYEQSYYKRSLDNENYVFTAPFYNLVGVKINTTNWMENFINITTKNQVQCKSELCGCERNSVIGKFFGEIDPGLMRSLINMSLYAFNKSYDYQSQCDPEEEPRQGAGLRSVHVPTIADILHLGWWASAAAWSILQQFFLGLTFPRFLGAVEVEDEDLSASPSKQSCITVQTQYFFGNDEKTFNNILDCINCSRLFHAEKISNTNLVFIMSDSKDMCSHCDARPLMQAEKPDEGPNPCEMVKQPRYRKGPDVCFDNDAKEDSSDCGGVSGLSPSLWSMVGIQFILLWLLSSSRHCQL
ncbi:hypothetical protein JD844_027565 [Phrynosoma platyrhinos]|uniref:Voltage-dependent calcium channel alpha-2/delta subunit conserved region domain-containing protein n=1 Tax=Phrynosoma platyrhinos TaxID=52577 RepID=A0ABQ7SGJ7_PHRPL|nr:hypothetical protein JD844_027565 [Phrynosoma platyrhinos]